tara:strand:+ start:2127 stop:3209 length:1083 start_codon:yes stop_codon:yes gene_type:complete
MSKWTKEQYEYVLKASKAGNSRNKIARDMQRIFGVKRTGKLINAKMHYEKKKEEKESENMNWKTEPATRKQCKYIAGLSLPEGSKQQRKQLEDSLYVQCVKGSMTKETASLQIEQLENLTTVVAKTKKPTSKKRRTRTTGLMSPNWTKEEDEIVIANYRTREDFPSVEKLLQDRTSPAVYQRFSKMRKDGRIAEFDAIKSQPLHSQKPKTVTVKVDSALEDLIEKHGNPITRHLSKDDVTLLKSVDKRMKTLDDSTNEAYDLNGMEVLLAFYEKSIDELREQFNAPFWAIAKILENIHDLKEPHHSDLLMEAARVTKERKDEEYRIANMSRRERRKIAKNAKKESKLQAKLDKLRGVINE